MPVEIVGLKRVLEDLKALSSAARVAGGTSA
jgi:hypothetical protein